MNALIWSPGLAATVVSQLRPEQFSDGWCRGVVAAVIDVVAAGERVTARTIHARLVAAGIHQPRDGWRLILADVSAPMAELPAHLCFVAERHRRRLTRDALVIALGELDAGVPVEALTVRLTARLEHLQSS